MAWSDDYDERDQAKVEVLRQSQGVAKRKWVCKRCDRQRPAGVLTQTWVGKVDGEFLYDRACAAVFQGQDCPYRVASWPLWRGTLLLRPGTPRALGRQDWFTREARAATEAEAREALQPWADGNPEYVLGQVVQVEAGVPQAETLTDQQERQQREALATYSEGEGPSP